MEKDNTKTIKKAKVTLNVRVSTEQALKILKELQLPIPKKMPTEISLKVS